jgi:hypothetical protein
MCEAWWRDADEEDDADTPYETNRKDTDKLRRQDRRTRVAEAFLSAVQVIDHCNRGRQYVQARSTALSPYPSYPTLPS